MCTSYMHIYAYCVDVCAHVCGMKFYDYFMLIVYQIQVKAQMGCIHVLIMMRKKILTGVLNRSYQMKKPLIKFPSITWSIMALLISIVAY